MVSEAARSDYVRLAALEDELAIRRASRSLRSFIPYAWPIVEPHREFKHNWHHDALAAHLEAVFEGHIKNLIINIPPATSKSLVVSVLFPAWVWIQRPWARFMCLSYDQMTISTRDCERMRTLVESGFYAQRWPKVRIKQFQNLKTRFSTTEGGYRIGTSFGGRIMGEHPHFKIIDDPHDPKRQLLSDRDVEVVNDTFNNKLKVRGATLDAATILVMQRLDERDLTGHWLSTDEDVVHLCLPMRWEPNRMVETPIGWHDPREGKPGALLWPDEWSEEKCDKTFKKGTWADAGQFQQRPAPSGGLMFKRDWFRLVESIPSNVLRWVRFWDVAGTEEGDGPRTAGVKMGVTSDGLFVISDVVKGRWTELGVDQIMQQTAKLDGVAVAIREEQEPGSAGKAVIKARSRRFAGYDYAGKPPLGDKPTRARGLRSQAENGNVVIAYTPTDRGVPPPWVSEFLSEIEMFPAGTLKDQVDGATGAFTALSGYVELELIGTEADEKGYTDTELQTAIEEELGKYGGEAL